MSEYEALNMVFFIHLNAKCFSIGFILIFIWLGFRMAVGISCTSIR